MNALTVDMEDYYQTNIFNIPYSEWNRFASRVERNARRLLECFESHQVKATFFVVACLAQSHPSLIREIADQGHEIGSHSMYHEILHHQNPDAFRADIRYSKQLLEDVSGSEVFQYRAPSWSISPDKYRWLSILEEEGYRIDSSIQPFRTPLSGSGNAPVAPFRPVMDGCALSLVEFPSTVWQWGPVRVPFLGGFYLRAMPLTLARYLLQKVNQSKPGMLYVHPWEIDSDQPRLAGPPLARIAQYYRLACTENKLNKLLDEFDFVPLGELVDHLIENAEIPAVPIF